MKKKKYPPFCVHLYHRHYYDFPYCTDNYDTIEKALKAAALVKGDYNLATLGYWDDPNPKKADFWLEEINLQMRLF